MKRTRVAVVVVVLMFVVLQLPEGCRGHARLWEPPSRSSMWRRGYNTSVNTNDNQLNCGGFENQWIRFGGKCGVCGDPYQDNPRENEYGGKYASDIITRTYPIGGLIDVIVGLTANHAGYFELRLCPIVDPVVSVTHECLDQHKLPFLKKGQAVYKYFITDPAKGGEVNMTAKLPEGLQCDHCVIQWRYRTGSRWGCESGRCGKGDGPQEEFYGCSDVAIADIPSTIHHDPVPIEDQYSGKVGLNDLGSASHKLMMTSRDVKRIPVTNHHLNHAPSTLTSTLTTLMPSYLATTLNKLTTNSVESRVSSFHQIVADAQRIAIDAIRKFYENERKIRKLPTAKCFAAREFHHNPIIHEWCMRLCPRDNLTCPVTMCDCDRLLNHNEPYINPAPSAHMFKQHTAVVQSLVPSEVNMVQTVKEIVLQTKPPAFFPTTRVQTFTPTPPRRAQRLLRVRPNTWKDVVDSYHSSVKPKSVTQKLLFDLPYLKVTKAPVQGLREEADKERMQQHKASVDNVILRNDLFAKVEQKDGDKKEFLFNIFSDVPSPSQLDTPADMLSQEPILPMAKDLVCTVSAQFAHNNDMKGWCMQNCAFGFCPRTICSCNM